MKWFRKLFARKSSPNSKFLSVKLFCEPPQDFPPENFVPMGLPKDFILTADSELNLNGDLIEFVQAQQPTLENIRQLNDGDRDEYFASLSTHGIWKVYFGSGSSGARYTVFVDFPANQNQSSATRSNTLADDVRKRIYKDFNTAFMKWVVRGTIHFPDMTDRERTETATNTAIDEVMKEHGISKNEVIEILNEGAEKWSSDQS